MGAMGVIAICCSLALGYGQRRSSVLLLLVVPLSVSVSFFLIADIDSPRGGVIPIHAENLLSLQHSIKEQ
jgi:hypothetical protein